MALISCWDNTRALLEHRAALARGFTLCACGQGYAPRGRYTCQACHNEALAELEPDDSGRESDAAGRL